MAATGDLTKDVVGRADELALLDAILDRAARGSAQTVLISGELGIGKTLLLARASGHREGMSAAMFGACLPLTSMSIPFLPIRSALRAFDQAGGDLPSPGAVDGDFALRFDGWLEQQCVERPVILGIDDLHWADPSTLDALMYVIAGPSSRRLAVVATIRSGEVGLGHPLQRWLADVRRLPRVTDLRLGPLDRDGTSAQIESLTGGTPHQSLVDDVHSRTLGNPYFTRLMVTGLPADARSAPARFPRDLRSAVLQSWSRLTTPTGYMASVLAVSGHPTPAEDLAEVLGEDAVRVRRHLRDAAVAGVVEAVEPGVYWFHHPLHAELLQAELSADEQQGLHRRFADLLERRELEQRAARQEAPKAEMAFVSLDAAVSIADHRYLANQARAAYDWTMLAADAVGGVDGWSEQVRLLRRAAELSVFTAQPETTLTSVLWRLRGAAARAGLFEDELVAVEQLLDIIDPAASPLAVSELLVRRSILGFSTGRDFAPLDELRVAVRLSAAAAESAEFAMALAELARAEFWNGLDVAEEHAGQAVAAARTARDSRGLAYACAELALILEARGDSVSAKGLAEEALVHSSSIGDWFAYARAVIRLADSVGAWTSEANASIVEGLRTRMALEGAPQSYLALLSALEAASRLVSGRLQDCHRLLRVALGSNPGALADAQARLVAARLATLQGRQVEAESHLARADELFTDTSAFRGMEFETVRVEVRLGARDWVGAFTAASAALTGSRVTRVMGEWLVPLAARALAEEIQAVRDTGGDARHELDVLEAFAGRFPHISDLGLGGEKWRRLQDGLEALYRGELARARADDRESDDWASAVDVCAIGGLAWEEAYASWRAAEAFLGRGKQRTAGAEMLRHGLALASALGARPIEDELRDLAHRSRIEVHEPEPDQSEHPALLHGLTAREREVLELIAVGRTYGEIARTFMISEKTVSTHVSHLLAKTGSANRVELARLVHRLSDNA